MTSKKKKGLVQPLTVITTHFNPDYDAIGSMVAARHLYPGATLVFPGGSEKNLRHFFVQSLFRALEPAPAAQVDLSRVERLVVVDTRQPARLGDLKAVLANPGLDIHLYDHHPDAPGDLKGSLEVVARVGATVTLLAEIIEARGGALPPEEATMVAVGLYEDTGSFTFSTTTGRDYRAAAFLLGQGVDLEVVSQLTVHEMSADQLALLNKLVASAETRQARGFNFVVAMAQADRYVDDVAVLAHKMMEIMGVSTLFVLVGMDNKVQLVIRSRLGTVDAAAIAREFGGGGHPSAAAASIRDMELNQAREKLDKILLSAVGQMYQAKSLMVYPPITVGQGETLARARDILIKFSINVLLAVDGQGRVVGFISEHNVSKAVHHGLLDFPVSAFMSTEFIAVGPEATFAAITEIIVDRKQRILPVVENGLPVGVITRTDLLQVLAEGIKDQDRPQAAAAQRNLSSQMREKLPPALLNFLDQMGHLAERLGVRLYAVGGCVRDIIMRLPTHDIDVTMDGDITAFIAQLAHNHKLTHVRRHPRFKTATVETAEGFSIDISTTRREYYDHPGALPVIEESSLRMDLYRRDFTINSLAVGLNPGNFGEVVDYFRGFQDIKDGAIRVLHNLSFIEDPTRAFRAVRFEARLGFKISKMTAGLLEGAAKSGFLAKVDRHRLLHELRLILGEDDPAPAISRLAEFGLLPFIHPAIALKPRHGELFHKARRVRDWLALTFPEFRPAGWLVYLLALTDELTPNQMAELAASLFMGRRDARLLTEERQVADAILARYKKALRPFPPSAGHRLFSCLSWPAILFVMAKTDNEELSQAGVSWLTHGRFVTALANGRDLMALGVPHGPAVRRALDDLRMARLDGLVFTLEDELAYARSRLGKYQGPAAAPAPPAA